MQIRRRTSGTSITLNMSAAVCYIPSSSQSSSNQIVIVNRNDWEWQSPDDEDDNDYGTLIVFNFLGIIGLTCSTVYESFLCVSGVSTGLFHQTLPKKKVKLVVPSLCVTLFYPFLW